jgi:hypothetical protein
VHRLIRKCLCWIGVHEWVETKWYGRGVVAEYYSCRHCNVPANPAALEEAVSDALNASKGNTSHPTLDYPYI